MAKSYAFLILICVLQTGIVLAQFNTTRKLCYSFSWMGPKFNNETVFSNVTCDDITKSTNSIPCRQPLVISNDGTPPDMDYIWENYLEDTTCLLTDDEVCASLTYRFNGFIQNVTYMCTRVLDENQQAVTGTTCIKSETGSRGVDLCICTSSPGQKPCNGANSLLFPTIMIFAMISILIYL